MNNDFPPPMILWFRRDLRLADNPALCFACEQNQPIIPVFGRLEKQVGGGYISL